MLVHAEQSIELHKPLPVEGTLRTSAMVTGMFDKGSGALIQTENKAVDAATGEPLVTTRGGTFVRGEGGFGGDRGTSDPWELPNRAPDHKVTQQTRPEQALLYRLSGDRNPLHADPAFAARGGFSRPILHGLCTYGITGRVLLHELCGSDPARFASMSGRFSRPVLPGESLVVSIWAGDERHGAVPDGQRGRHRGHRPGRGAVPVTRPGSGSRAVNPLAGRTGPHYRGGRVHRAA